MKAAGTSGEQKGESIRNGFLLALAAVLTIAIVFATSATQYASVRDNLMLRGELSTTQSADELGSYLLAGKNALLLSAYVVDNMQSNGSSTEDIHDYMVEESDRLIQVIDHDYTGLYGWIGGEYLDGVNWVPDDDFIATERPWYIKAMAEEPGQLVFVEPYLDAQTNTIMITVAERLSDGKSVIALDFSLSGMMKITEEIARNLPGSESIVLDQNGGVVVHSDAAQIGSNYLEEANALGHEIAQGVLDGETHFNLNFQGKTYVVYSKAIEGGWHSISVIDGDSFYQPLYQVLSFSVAAFIGSIALIAIAFLQLKRRNKQMRNLNVQLSTIADVYESVYDIDLTLNSIRAISQHAKLDLNGLDGEKGMASSSVNAAVDIIASEDSRPLMREFLDLSTLPERMGARKSITTEYLDNNNCWSRCRLIEAGRNQGGSVTRVILATESIDEEKRNRDRLVHLSETDQLTDVYNRGSSERKIRELLEKGVGGMFILLDVDDFKSVNDRFGHSAGDRVLIEVANCLKNSFRTGDIVARFGGDEFAAFAPTVLTPEIGAVIAERLFDNLQKANIEELGDEGISVSIGAAFAQPGEPISFQELYKQADIRTYRSKETKGNRIEF